MNKNINYVYLVLGLIVILGLGYYLVGQNRDVQKTKVVEENEIISTVEDNTIPVTENIQKEVTGTYEVFVPEKISQSGDKKIVLFFRASWCPTCRSLDADIKKNLSSIPKDVVILDVDYDKYVDLKKKYGVTYQHTLVQVTSDDNIISKWSGSPTLASLLSKLKIR